MCVVLALFLCRLVCCCSVRVRLRGLECVPWFNKTQLQSCVLCRSLYCIYGSMYIYAGLSDGVTICLLGKKVVAVSLITAKIEQHWDNIGIEQKKHTHTSPVVCVSSMTCFPTQQHLPQASNKTQIKDNQADLSPFPFHNVYVHDLMLMSHLLFCSLASY